MANRRPDPRKNRIISWRAIREFILAHPEDTGAPDAFARWYDLVRHNRFANFSEVRRTFPSADLIGDLVVFNIRGNRYRLIARFIYEKGRVYVRRVLTHAEYDRGDWKEGVTAMNVGTKTRPDRCSPEYLALVRAFPPRPIRDDDDHRRAIEVVNGLLDRQSLTADEEDYLDVLGLLIADYEDSIYEHPESTPVERLRHLMEEHSLTQAELARARESP